MTGLLFFIYQIRILIKFTVTFIWAILRLYEFTIGRV